ncbi:MAG TPA: response regulator transcription factor, partial [Myxococcota bacterium]|nr:response regulator transcription factor [Myxococcota bacterium]
MPQILVVEDSKDAQELIRRALRDAGDVAFAESGSECVELASTQPPDLFLVDVELPDMDGFELCASLKSNAMLENIPVVFLTGRADVQDKVMGFRLGAEDYIAKPFAAAELRVRVEARLRGHGRRDARLAFDDMTLDLVRHEVRLREGDSERVCDLTPHEF